MGRIIAKLLLFVIICGVFLHSDFIIAGNSVGIFVIQHRDANDIKASIQGFLAKDAVATVDQNKLIIQSNPDDLVNIKKIIESLDVAKQQLKLAIYYGDNPEAIADSTIITTSGQQNNTMQTLLVEDGEAVSLQENKILRLTKAVAGNKQHLQEKSQEKKYREVNSAEVATAATEVVTKSQVLKTAEKELKTTEDKIAGLARLADGEDIERLKGGLTGKKTAVINAKNALEQAQAKQNSLTTSANATASENQKETNYNAAAGAIEQDYINLPEGIYIKPKILYDKQLKVDINIVKANDAVKNNAATDVQTVTKQVQTSLQMPANKWREISGQDEITSSNEQVTTYSTSTNDHSKKIWLKIEFVD